MRLRFLLALCLVAAFAIPASATHYELTAFGGYRFGGTIKDSNTPAQPLTELEIEDGPCVGLIFDLRTSMPMLLLEVFWEHQFTNLNAEVISTGEKTTLGALSVDYLHAGFMYEFSAMYDTSSDPPLRPFLGFTLGATRFGPEGLDPEWRFSIGLMLGAKYFPWERVGFRLQTRLMTTYFNGNTDTFCDPVTGDCYSITNAAFMNQGDITLGVILEF